MSKDKRNFLTVAIIIIPFFILVWFDQEAMIKWWVAIAALCVIVIYLDKFKTLSIGAGKFEAELRDVIEEAQTTIKDLKNTTEPLITFSLAQLTQSHLIHGVDARDKETLYKRAKQLVDEFKITDDRTHELLKNSLSVIYVQYLTNIEFACSNYVPLDVEHYKEGTKVREYFSELKNKFTENQLAINPNAIRNFFKENPHYNNDDVQKLIDSYESFISNNL